MGLGEKLSGLLKEKGIKPGTLSTDINVNRSTIYSIIRRNNTKVDLSIIQSIADYLGVSIDYFFDNATSNEAALTPKEHEIIKMYRSMDQRGKDIFYWIAAREVELSKKYKQQMDEEIVDIIVYDFPAAAGIPVFAEDAYTRIKYKASDIPKGADFGIRIAGDSMEPTINDGDIVFVHKTSSLKNNEIGIFMLDVSEAVCKRYLKNGKAVELRSDNPAYAPLILKPHQQLGIVGRVLLYK